MNIDMGTHRLSDSGTTIVLYRKTDPEKAKHKKRAEGTEAEARWGSPTYHSTLNGVFTEILKERVMASTATTITELRDVIVAEQRRLQEEIAPLLTFRVPQGAQLDPAALVEEELAEDR